MSNRLSYFKSKIQFIVFLIIFPLMVNFFTYFGYVSSYTREVFSPLSFSLQYDSGIYKYRILGKFLLLEIDKFISNSLDYKYGEYLNRIFKFIDNDTSFSLYIAYFSINSFSLILSSITFYFILSHFGFTRDKSFLIVLFFNLFIGVTQYVVVPYDNLSYFFTLLTSLLFFKYLIKKNLLFYISILLMIITSTLIRESSALNVVMMVIILYQKFDFKVLLAKSVPLIMAFFVPYIILRIILGFDQGIIHSLIIENITDPFNLIGIGYVLASSWVVFLYAKYRNTRSYLIVYLALIIPYIITVVLSGTFFEVRLWTPVLINMFLILIYYDYSQNQFSTYSQNQLLEG